MSPQKLSEMWIYTKSCFCFLLDNIHHSSTVHTVPQGFLCQHRNWYGTMWTKTKQKAKTSNMVPSFSVRLTLLCNSWKMAFHVWTQKSKWDNMKAFQYSVNTTEPYNPAHPAYLLITGTLLENLTITKGERKAYSSYRPSQQINRRSWMVIDWY